MLDMFHKQVETMLIQIKSKMSIPAHVTAIYPLHQMDVMITMRIYIAPQIINRHNLEALYRGEDKSTGQR